MSLFFFLHRRLEIIIYIGRRERETESNNEGGKTDESEQLYIYPWLIWDYF